MGQCIIALHILYGTKIPNYSARVDGCILGQSTKVGEKANLLKCVTQPGYEVNAGGTPQICKSDCQTANIASPESFKNEKLDISNWGGESHDDKSDDDQTSEDE